MPSQAEIKRIGINPFAVCSSNKLKRGTAKYERCVEGVTRSAQKRVGVRKQRK